MNQNTLLLSLYLLCSYFLGYLQFFVWVLVTVQCFLPFHLEGLYFLQCLSANDEFSPFWLTWKYVSFFFTFNRQCCLDNSTLNISSPLHSGHHYFDETSLLCEGPFPSRWFKDSLLTIWLWEVQVWISFSLSCFVYFEIFQMSRLKFFIKFKKLSVFISSNILSASPHPCLGGSHSLSV